MSVRQTFKIVKLSNSDGQIQITGQVISPNSSRIPNGFTVPLSSVENLSSSTGENQPPELPTVDTYLQERFKRGSSALDREMKSKVDA